MTSRSTRCFFLLLMSVWSIGIAKADPIGQTVANPDFAISVKPRSSRFPAGAPALIDIVLTNKSPATVRFPDTNLRVFSEPFDLFSVTLTDANGKAVPYTAEYSNPNKATFAIIRDARDVPKPIPPGGSMTFTEDIRSRYDLTEPGVYTITVSQECQDYIATGSGTHLLPVPSILHRIGPASAAFAVTEAKSSVLPSSETYKQALAGTSASKTDLYVTLLNDFIKEQSEKPTWDGYIAQYQAEGNGVLARSAHPLVPCGRHPNTIVFDKEQKHAFVLTDAADIWQYDVNDNGALSPHDPPVIHAGDEALSLVISPDGKSAYVGLSRQDRIDQYAVLPSGGLSSAPIAHVRLLGGPMYLAETPAGTFLYAAIANCITPLAVDPGGKLRNIVPLPTLSGRILTALCISRDGRFLYATNFGDGTVSQFEITPDGPLQPLATPHVSTGKGPKLILTAGGLPGVYVATSDAENHLTHYTASEDGSLQPNPDGYEPRFSNPFSLATNPDHTFLYGLSRYSQAVESFAIVPSGDFLARDPSDQSSLPYDPTAMACVTVPVTYHWRPVANGFEAATYLEKEEFAPNETILLGLLARKTKPVSGSPTAPLKALRLRVVNAAGQSASLTRYGRSVLGAAPLPPDYAAIAASNTAAAVVDLTRIFDLTVPGRYTVFASLVQGGTTTDLASQEFSVKEIERVPLWK